MMKRRLHIIAACADRKRSAALPELRLRAHRSTTHRARFQSFIDALEAAAGEATPAVELYAGPYWATIRDLPALAEAQGLHATLWVASAGYGLIPATALVRPYSATFQTGVPDSVAFGACEHSVRDQVSAWWSALATWPGPARLSPRSIAGLAASDPASVVMVIASPRYVQALGADLATASAELPDRLIVVSSADAKEEHGLADLLVPSEAPLLSVVGGSLPALHARVAKHILQGAPKHDLSASALRTRYRRLIASSDYRGMPDREEATDGEVVAFIRAALRRRPDLKYTPALRAWREGGRACEQKRFKRLLHEVVSKHVH